ncbi:MAG: bifunctional diguanylate cyclase/phosphodiesterase [Trueperaceae bacterium]|nr:bifunctional diguanylate cyclase/phosphodiesterase [Trueperaceae bacterium]
MRRHDPLTGLLNRPAFEAELAHASGATGVGAVSGQDALATFNIDQFRLLNETYGHARGDRALRDVAGLIQRLSTPTDRSARLGNDEFAWLLRGTDLPAARARCETLLERIRTEGVTDLGSHVRITASVGLVAANGVQDASTLLQCADAATLAAKADGGDRVHEWQEDDTRLAERRGALRWIREIREALDEDRFTVFAQPIVASDPAARSVPAVEALIRMRTREEEIVPAGRFMPAAERYGLASRIDDWMVKAVLAWLTPNPARRKELRHVHVNLSGRSLGDPAFLAALEVALVASRALLPSLCFEVTETALIENLDTARDVMTRLHDLGCRFALDDFGIGHSSMRYLKRLPVDYLKIDGVFVRDMARDPEAAKLVGQIHRLARTMGLGTIAEFVESDEIRSRLRGLGVQEVQGYAVGKPAPLDEAVAACAQRTPTRGAFRPR